jgi:hypothetical protein
MQTLLSQVKYIFMDRFGKSGNEALRGNWCFPDFWKYKIIPNEYTGTLWTCLGDVIGSSLFYFNHHSSGMWPPCHCCPCELTVCILSQKEGLQNWRPIYTGAVRTVCVMFYLWNKRSGVPYPEVSSRPWAIILLEVELSSFSYFSLSLSPPFSLSVLSSLSPCSLPPSLSVSAIVWW